MAKFEETEIPLAASGISVIWGIKRHKNLAGEYGLLAHGSLIFSYFNI